MGFSLGNFDYASSVNTAPAASPLSGAAATSFTPASTFSSGGLLAGLSVVQGLSSLASSYYQAQAQKAQANYQANVQRMNAEIADVQGKQAIEQGDEAADKYAEQVQGVIGSQRATMGASGIALDSGTALDIQKQTAQQGQLDLITIKNNAWLQAWGYKTAAITGRSQAEFSLLQGTSLANSTLLTGGINATTSAVQAGYLLARK